MIVFTVVGIWFVVSVVFGLAFSAFLLLRGRKDPSNRQLSLEEEWALWADLERSQPWGEFE